MFFGNTQFQGAIVGINCFTDGGFLKCFPHVTEDFVLRDVWETLQKATIRKAIDAYNRALELGIAKEQARSVLPEGNTVSRLYMNGTLRSWLHYVDVRTSADTQAEHRLIATKCSDILHSLENL